MPSIPMQHAPLFESATPGPVVGARVRVRSGVVTGAVVPSAVVPGAVVRAALRDGRVAVQRRRLDFARDFLALSGLFGTIYGWFWFAAAMGV